MNALVVYESLWGSTAAVAKAIAEGLGNGTRALSTADATPADVAAVDLVVVGCPILGFNLPNDQMLEAVRTNPGTSKRPDVSQPSMDAWLSELPRGTARFTTFDTRVGGFIHGSAFPKVAARLSELGYRQVHDGAYFQVKGKFGPLREGETDRARSWGASLAGLMKSQ